MFYKFSLNVTQQSCSASDSGGFLCVCQAASLTLWVGLLVGVAGINEAGGRVQFVLKLHVEPSGLTERAPRSCTRTHTRTHRVTVKKLRIQKHFKFCF